SRALRAGAIEEAGEVLIPALRRGQARLHRRRAVADREHARPRAAVAEIHARVCWSATGEDPCHRDALPQGRTALQDPRISLALNPSPMAVDSGPRRRRPRRPLATRLVEPARTSPMAKTPGQLVSSGKARLRPVSAPPMRLAPVTTKPLSST